MAKKDFEWDYSAAGNLMLRSSEISAICESEAARLTRATGVNYVPDVQMGRTRVRAGGFQKASEADMQRAVCPKCGEWHPRCNCRT